MRNISKKALEASPTLIIMIIFIVGLAIVILLILFLSGEAGDPASGFTKLTEWGNIFKWG
jgi:cytochrome c biogenesis protein CcdA